MSIVSKTKITARYAETDQMGIIHHSVYPIWYEAARTEFIKEIGITYSDMEKQGILLPLVSLNCNYHGASFYEDEIIIETSVKLLTPVKIEFLYKLYKRSADGTVQEKPFNTGSTLHAWTDKSLKITNMKKHHPQIYKLLEDNLKIVKPYTII